MPRITRLEIKNFRGIRDLSWEVPPAGAVIKGKNGGGKTSVLKAIGAALAAQGVGPEAIRKGADGAEILVDLDAFHVRRSITAKGSSVTVTNGEGDAWRKPQTRLTELLGTSPLDPLQFFLADAKERRRQVLEASPVTITGDDLERWTTGVDGELAVDLSGHGLEVLERLRKYFYDRRTAANKLAKDSQASAAAAEPSGPPIEDALPLADARAARETAERQLQELRGREAAAFAAAEGTQKTRERVAQLRASAVKLTADLPASALSPNGRTNLHLAVDEAEQLVYKIRRQLDEAIAAEARARAAFESARQAVEEHDRLVDQADDLEESIAGVAGMAIAPEDLEAAVKVVADAKVNLGIAEDAEDARIAGARHAELRAIAKVAEGQAAALDRVVKALTETAPLELASRSALIPGLTVDGDSIALDDVAIDSLSGAEQMRFAVDLCRRLNAKAKILVVDGLEALDDDSLDAFVKFATADNWQLIATRVAKGELVVEAIAS